MSQRAKYLEKKGWTCTSRKKRGMFWIERWWKSGHGTQTQEGAYNLQRQYDKLQKKAEA